MMRKMLAAAAGAMMSLSACGAEREGEVAQEGVAEGEGEGVGEGEVEGEGAAAEGE